MLVPPAHGHALEPTALSLTETVVEVKEDFGGASTYTKSETLTFSTSPTRACSSSRPTPERRERPLDPCLATHTIPPEHENRTLILCFDGSGDQFDADNSNIVQLVSTLKKDDRTKQMVYYQVRSFFVTMLHIQTSLLGWYWYIHPSQDCDASAVQNLNG